MDAGVDYDLPYEKGIINMKVRKGTRNYLHEAAMTETEMELAWNGVRKWCAVAAKKAVTYSVSGKWE